MQNPIERQFGTLDLFRALSLNLAARSAPLRHASPPAHHHHVGNLIRVIRVSKLLSRNHLGALGACPIHPGRRLKGSRPCTSGVPGALSASGSGRRYLLVPTSHDGGFNHELDRMRRTAGIYTCPARVLRRRHGIDGRAQRERYGLNELWVLGRDLALDMSEERARGRMIISNFHPDPSWIVAGHC